MKCKNFVEHCRFSAFLRINLFSSLHVNKMLLSLKLIANFQRQVIRRGTDILKLEFHHINYASDDVEALNDFYVNILKMDLFRHKTLFGRQLRRIQDTMARLCLHRR